MPITLHSAAPMWLLVQTGKVPMVQVRTLPVQVKLPLELLEEEEEEPPELLEEVEEGTQVASPGKNAAKGLEVTQPGVFIPDMILH